MMPVLIALFVLYVLVTAWFMRRALGTRDPEARLRAAKLLLFTTFLGVPLLVAFIFAI